LLDAGADPGVKAGAAGRPDDPKTPSPEVAGLLRSYGIPDQASSPRG
jgi:hypothetical protein